MRALLALAVIAGLATSALADEDTNTRADKGTLGIGIILGEPTGVSVKLYLKDDQAIQGAAGFAFVGGGLHVHADYVFHPWILQAKESFVLPFYFGPGVRVIDYRQGGGGADYFAIGLRVVAGLLFDFKTVPLDAFVEVGGVGEYRFKGHGFAPALNAAAGVRYYF